MRSGDRFEGFDAGKLSFEGPVMIETGAMDNFDGAKCTKPIKRNPHLAISARGNGTDQFVFGDFGQAQNCALQRWVAGAHVDCGIA